jgi:hypothetical protein
MIKKRRPHEFTIVEGHINTSKINRWFVSYWKFDVWSGANPLYVLQTNTMRVEGQIAYNYEKNL